MHTIGFLSNVHDAHETLSTFQKKDKKRNISNNFLCLLQDTSKDETYASFANLTYL